MRLLPHKSGPAYLPGALLVVLMYQALHAQETTPPRVIYGPDPEYSKQARTQQLEGTCVLRAIVGTDGATYDIKMEQPLGGGLDEKAIEALRRWRFEPARKFGRPVVAEVHVEMTFWIHFSHREREEFRAKLRDALPPPAEIPISTTIEPCPVRVHEAER